MAMVPQEFLDGQPTGVSLLEWHCQKLPRLARSTPASEIQSVSSAEGLLFLARACWQEVLTGQAPTKEAPLHQYVASVPAVLVTDSKTVYDAVHTPCSGFSSRDKHAFLEMAVLRQQALQTRLSVRWVHSTAMLANSLTKPQAVHESELGLFFTRKCTWSLPFNPLFVSARKRREAGLSPLQEAEPSRGSQS